MKVRISRRNIEEGKQRKSNFCALALAIKEHTKYQGVLVYPNEDLRGAEIRLDDWYFLSKEANDFALQFDKDKSKVKPCTVEIFFT